ncbi:MAG TPA: class I SAM-dependent methyltransferase [Dehalococcoidia bacterium]|nr:class I SAM-dependent methyltransferase [Dehalococcoidia bacterium]
MEEYVYDVLKQDGWWWEVGRRALSKGLLRHYAKSNGNGRKPRLLEIGCGSGALLEDLSADNVVYGMDIADEALAICRERGLDCVSKGDVTALPYADAAFDTVIAIDVLEHIDDDAAAVREIYRVCKPAGLLIVTVPAFQMLWSRRDVDHHHKRRYRVREIRRRLKDGGFKVIKATYVNLPIFFPLFFMVKAGQLSPGDASSVAKDFGIVPAPANAVLSRLMEAEARLLPHVDLPFGTSIACVGMKRL